MECEKHSFPSIRRRKEKWSRPKEGWCKVNFDGAYFEDSGKGGLGAGSTGYCGRFLAAVAAPVQGLASPLHAEALAARLCVSLVNSLGIKSWFWREIPPFLWLQSGPKPSLIPFLDRSLMIRCIV